MPQYRYIIVNNAGHSWPVQAAEANGEAVPERADPTLPQLLQEGWVPVRETAMGGGTSPLAHSLILLERTATSKTGRRSKG
jgi:hypothetical protein